MHNKGELYPGIYTTDYLSHRYDFKLLSSISWEDPENRSTIIFSRQCVWVEATSVALVWRSARFLREKNSKDMMRSVQNGLTVLIVDILRTAQQRYYINARNGARQNLMTRRSRWASVCCGISHDIPYNTTNAGPTGQCCYKRTWN